MRLRTKFIILIASLVIVSYGLIFYRVSLLQQELVFSQAGQQARMLHKQILLTRKWIADHNGIFVQKDAGVKANPFLADPEIIDAEGRSYVKRNPAMVTRELSLYADREGLGRYRVTTLKPVNPANAPDEFERHSLLLFEQGVGEVVEVHATEAGKVLQYIAPLFVEESCLECHAKQGYRLGDIRGGLSITIPMEAAYARIAANNRMILIIGIIMTCLGSGMIFLLIDFLVVRRLSLLATAMDRFSVRDDDAAAIHLPAGKDEIGWVADRFRELRHRLITSQQELDATRKQMFQNEKLAALGSLAAGVAHEINNPLGGMLNCLKIMRENPDNGSTRTRYQELLGKGLRRIEHIVRQLLNFGRSEPLKIQAVQVDELVRECLDLMGYQLKNIDLRLDLNLRQPYPVDVEALRQVIVNISLNAVQAMENGGVLTVRTSAADSAIVLVFEDTGAGMEAEVLDKIFDPFFTTKEVGQGTGLGLSVSHSLIKRMRGTVTVKSAKGKGARFVVALPAAPE